MDSILLECEKCGNTMDYDRDIDPSIPENVVRISHTACIRCETGGEFIIETMFDVFGNVIIND